MPRETVQIERITITPDDARELLEKFSDPNKRKVRNSVVERYARDMAAGRWTFNGEAIMRNGNGELKNGHHRLEACVRANAPFETLVVSGLGDDILPTIDTGQSRTAGDLLHWIEIPYPNDVAALANLGVRYDRMVVENRWRPVQASQSTRQEVLDWVEKNPLAVASVDWVLAEIGKGFGLPRSVLTFSHFLLARFKSPTHANRFFTEAISGSGAPESAVGRWRSYVAGASMRGRGTKPAPLMTLAITIKAMRYWLNDQNPPGALRWRQATKNGRAVEPFPRIDGSVPAREVDFEVVAGYQIQADYTLPGQQYIARIKKSMITRHAPWVVSDIAKGTGISPEPIRAVLAMLLSTGEVVATTKKLRGAEGAMSFIGIEHVPESLGNV